MIGILGAYGDIGLNVIRTLKKLGITEIKGCGRDVSKVSEKVKAEFPFVIWHNVDVSSLEQLRSFAKDCDVVVNCTPSYHMSGIIAGNMAGCGCKYVDAGFSEEFYDMPDNSGDTLIFAAGSTPGLSMMLCRSLAKNFVRTDSIRYIFGALDVFSYGAARDYIEGIGSRNNVPLSAYKNGVKTAMAAKRQLQAEVPMFPRRVELCPFSDTETDLIMKYTGAKEGVFYIALDGKFLTGELNKIRMKYDQSPEEAVSDLMKVSRLEMTDKSGYIRFLIEAAGETENGDESMTLYFMNESSSELTGSVAACTAYLAHEGRMAAGAYPCACAENFEEITDLLLKVCSDAVFQVIPGKADSLLESCEGEI